MLDLGLTSGCKAVINDIVDTVASQQMSHRGFGGVYSKFVCNAFPNFASGSYRVFKEAMVKSAMRLSHSDHLEK
jgi:hypothetical protein